MTRIQMRNSFRKIPYHVIALSSIILFLIYHIDIQASYQCLKLCGVDSTYLLLQGHIEPFNHNHSNLIFKTVETFPYPHSLVSIPIKLDPKVRMLGISDLVTLDSNRIEIVIYGREVIVNQRLQLEIMNFAFESELDEFVEYIGLTYYSYFDLNHIIPAFIFTFISILIVYLFDGVGYKPYIYESHILQSIITGIYFLVVKRLLSYSHLNI